MSYHNKIKTGSSLINSSNGLSVAQAPYTDTHNNAHLYSIQTNTLIGLQQIRVAD